MGERQKLLISNGRTLTKGTLRTRDCSTGLYRSREVRWFGTALGASAVASVGSSSNI